ncbi:MAG: LppU/SCO3897 family protein [Sporichthyaceae bacterium]
MTSEPIDLTPPPPPPPPPAKRSVQRYPVLIVLTATSLLVAASLAATTARNKAVTDASGPAEIGDCVGAFQAGFLGPTGDQITKAPAERVDCTEPGAAYRIALTEDSAYAACPSPSYRVRRVGVGSPAEQTLCLTYNVRAEECFLQAPINEAGPYDCDLGPRPSAIRILRVVEGVEDPMRCRGLGDSLLVTTVPEPATTFCYVAFETAEPGVRTT